MKIKIFRSYNPFYDSSASGSRYLSLIQGLKKLNVDITIVVTGGFRTKEEEVEVGNFSEIKILYISKRKNYTLWQRRINKYLLDGVIQPFLRQRVRKELLKSSDDYVWLTNDSLILSSFNMYRNKIKAKTLIELNEFHDIYKQEGNISNRLQLEYARKSEQIFLSAIKGIDLFAVMTNTLLNYYKSIANPNAAFIHLPMTVDIDRFNIRKSDASKKYIAFAGTLNNNKDGVNILIESFARVSHKYPDYELQIAGFYHQDVEQQKELIRKYNLQDKIIYKGVLTKDRIPQFLIDASILVLARPESHQASGGFPTKLGEYLATKNPVCITVTGEIGNYLQDNVSAYLATPGDVDSFADALDRAMSDEKKAREVGLAGYNVARLNFDKNIQSKRLYDFLQVN